MSIKKVLITGACGFIGHHMVEHFMKNTDWDIIGIDKLSYASLGFSRIRDIYYEKNRLRLFTWDLVVPLSEYLMKEIGDIDYIIHLAAETHVDNSIADPRYVINNNILSMVNILEFARMTGIEKFIYFSTDEIYGPAPVGVVYREGDRHNPTNAYSASKAASEDICIAYANTYKLPILITNTMNVIGERQHPEKFVPLVINKLLKNEKIIIHSDSNGVPGSRFYIHARNLSGAVLFILNNINETVNVINASCGKFNICGDEEISNLEMVNIIADIVGINPIYECVNSHANRPGHDLRYALDGNKLLGCGFIYKKSLRASVAKLVEWTLLPENRRWLECVR